MSLSSLGFLIEEAAKNIRRNGLMSIAALSIVTLAMSVFGGALYTLYRTHQIVEDQPKQFEMEAFVKIDTKPEQVKEVMKRIQAISQVASVKLYPKETAEKEWLQKDRQSGTNIASALDTNPFPDRLDIGLHDQRNTGTVSALLRDAAKFPEIEKVNDAADELGKIYEVSRLVRNVGGVAAVLLFIATALVIQNTIRLTVFARRKEIRIMQLVGATSAFIRLPMILEGIFYGVVGAAVAAALVILVAAQTSNLAGKVISPLALSLPEAVAPGIVFGGLLAVGAFVGWLGSAMSVRKFLKRI
jgi:cell division transport system permease protein